jgi:hypothetical protein
MPRYEVEQYETHVQTCRVTADSEAEAIAKVLNDNDLTRVGPPEYLETNMDLGLSAAENQELVKELGKLRVYTHYDTIPSIRSVIEIKEPSV